MAHEQKNKRKIIIMISHLSKGGAQLAAYRVARGLQARGWPTEMWFLYRQSNEDFSAVPHRVFLDKRSPGVGGYLKIMGALIAAMMRERPAVVMSFLPLASTLGLFAAWLARTPVRIASLRSPGTTFSRPMRILDKLFGSIGIYTGIVAVSRAVADAAADYPARYRKIMRVVHNGVEPFETPLSREEARAELGLNGDDTIAVAVGRIAPQKNIPFLLDIAERLKDTKIVCVGDGPDRAGIEAEIAARNLGDKVIMLGALPPSQVPLAYKASEIFIQPSLFEGQSNSVLEAMSAKLPVVVSDIPSQTETVIGDESENGPFGVALPLDDPEIWAKTIDDLAAHRAKREHLATLSKRRTEDFTVEGQINGFEALIA